MLNNLFSPSTIAIIGASAVPGKIGYKVLENLINCGYRGEIVPINPKSAEILGTKCYPDISDYKGKIDSAVITVPAELAKESVQKCIKAGAKAITVITAGFKEVSHEGAVLEKELVEICKASGVRMLGPNCLGVINTYHSMNMTFDPRIPPKGGIAVISQSGALCGAILAWALSNNVGMSKIISIGNKADLNEVDLLEALADDPQTKVIVAYLESIADGDRFIKIAEKVTKKKPVVIFKAGTSSAGMKAASSHTGSLAGADVAYTAAFKKTGVVRAETFDQLFDLAIAFSMQPLPLGRDAAIITNAGGLGVICSDALENKAFSLAQLSPSEAETLKKKLPAAASVANPIDVLGDTTAERYETATKAAMESNEVDAVIAFLTVNNPTIGIEIADGVIASNNGKKPLFTSFIGGKAAQETQEHLMAKNLPNFSSPERAVAALNAMFDYNIWHKKPSAIIETIAGNKKAVEEILNKYKKTGNKQIGEVDAKKILNAYGFAVPEGGLCVTADDAVNQANRSTYPVVMKIVSKDIIHKSDVGGVKINLQNAVEVKNAYEDMMKQIKAKMPNAKIDGVYIEQMAPKGTEVILGMTRDIQFGPLIMFGLGGIFVEVMKDVAFTIAPVSKEEAMDTIKSIRSFPLLEGVRGQAAADIEAIAKGMQSLGQLVVDFPQITELDINPFIVGSKGNKSMAADGRLTLSEDWMKE